MEDHRPWRRLAPRRPLILSPSAAGGEAPSPPPPEATHREFYFPDAVGRAQAAYGAFQDACISYV